MRVSMVVVAVREQVLGIEAITLAVSIVRLTQVITLVAGKVKYVLQPWFDASASECMLTTPIIISHIPWEPSVSKHQSS